MKPDTYCAQRLTQVESAWGLVYRRYMEQGLVDENPHQIHTMPEAVGAHACVIYQQLRDEVTCTMTVMADSSGGLPLDSVYGKALNDFRERGRGLVEVGLLADRRHDIKRTAKALFQIMTWAAYFTLGMDKTDVVVGVHPHHVGFYQRAFGFVSFAEQKEYPTVNRKPVVPLWLPLVDALQWPSLPPGLHYVRDHVIPFEQYAERFEFLSENLKGSRIKKFLDG